MNWVDAVVLIVVLASTFVGWRTGILKTAFTVSGMLIGFFLGTNDGVGEFFLNKVDDKSLASFLSFVIPFTLTMVMARILWTIMRKTLQFVMLGWIDGAIGAVLGMIISALTLSVGTIAVCKLGISVVVAAISESIFGTTLVSFSVNMISILVRSLGMGVSINIQSCL
jgi:uncharacterized membrane protein required for colicin V production